jgi:hypothetical protein
MVDITEVPDASDWCRSTGPSRRRPMLAGTRPANHQVAAARAKPRHLRHRRSPAQGDPGMAKAGTGIASRVAVGHTVHCPVSAARERLTARRFQPGLPSIRRTMCGDNEQTNKTKTQDAGIFSFIYYTRSFPRDLKKFVQAKSQQAFFT